jgi:L-lactate dehydrogenase complex protein LldG
MNARAEVLARIAAAHRAASPPATPYENIARYYRVSSDLDQPALTELLVDRLLDYRALVRRCSHDDLAETIAEALADRGARTVVVPAGLDPSWLAGLAVEVRIDESSAEDQQSVAELDGTDGVITTCAAAIAETGTLILDGSPGQGRRVITLIPDYHLVVVLPDTICGDVPQALSRLDATRPLTMISGPSATSDIELNRVEGVHGPRTLEVIIVAAQNGSQTSSSTPLAGTVRPLQQAQREGNERARSVPTGGGAHEGARAAPTEGAGSVPTAGARSVTTAGEGGGG